MTEKKIKCKYCGKEVEIYIEKGIEMFFEEQRGFKEPHNCKEKKSW